MKKPELTTIQQSSGLDNSLNSSGELSKEDFKEEQERQEIY